MPSIRVLFGRHIRRARGPPSSGHDHPLIHHQQLKMPESPTLRRDALVTNTPHHNRLDLQEVTTRGEIARDIIAGFSTATPTLADIWHYVETALADTPALVTEITHLRAQLSGTRLHRANLVAAIRATIAAHHDGEDDPLSYLRDELLAQGYHVRGRS
jgi:hypothetical protein